MYREVKYWVLKILLLFIVGTSVGQTNTYVTGSRNYEFGNHLDNILTVQSDKKIHTTLGLLARTASYSDYYPYGMQMPTRYGTNSSYRYGFNRMEKDNDIKGKGNSLDFGARIYDPRLGRWLSRDPKESSFPEISTYTFCYNGPITFNDPTGENGELTIVDNDNEHSVTLSSRTYLIGNAAKQWDGQTTMYTEKIRDKDDPSKIWTVTYKVEYVYDETVETALAEHGLTDPTNYTDKTWQGTIESYNDLRDEGKLALMGVAESENVIFVDTEIQTQSGIYTKKGQANGGGGLAYVHPSVGNVATRDHETGHLMGLDERYNQKTARVHEGFEGDMMSNTSAPAGTSLNMDPLHLVDILDYAMENGKVNGTVTVGKTGGGKGKPYYSNFEIDNTSHGRDPESQESVQSKHDRVVQE